MLTTTDFFNYGRIVGWTTIGLGVLAVLGFLFKWGIRFRLVGITGFLGVLTGGLFSLSLAPIIHTQIPGAVSYSLVYDTGAAETVIAVSNQITPTELEATLQQAASDLFSPGRMGPGTNELLIRARTIVHLQPDTSQPLFLGEVRRSLLRREDPTLQISLYPEAIKQLGT